MLGLKARIETTEHALSVIDFNIREGYFGAAIIVASNYVQLRLGTILAISYSKMVKTKRWEEVAEIFRDALPHTLVNRGEELDLVKRREANRLHELFNYRNNAAHKTVLWRARNEVPKSEAAKAKRLCGYAKEFMVRTDEMSAWAQ